MRKMLSFIISILLILVMVISLSGCGSNDEGKVLINSPTEHFTITIKENNLERVNEIDLKLGKNILLYDIVSDTNNYYYLKTNPKTGKLELATSPVKTYIKCTKLIQYDNYFEVELYEHYSYTLHDDNGRPIKNDDGSFKREDDIFIQTKVFTNSSANYII